MEIFPKVDLVYLTSDTDNVLSVVDTSKVYIIGGIVDHNRLKVDLLPLLLLLLLLYNN